jgi:hypothetical protein
MAKIARVVALGASNLTRGFHAIVSTARLACGPEVQVLAALGLGRSYGASSRAAFRTLPGILQSGLWRTLESLPAVPTRALVTDVGNDILYGYSAEQIIAWVGEALTRLQRITQDIHLTDLPLASIRKLSPVKFLIIRSILYPPCRLSLADVLETAERVNTGLVELVTIRGLRLVRLNPSWYGLDPIHIRPSLWQPAWQEILDIHPGNATKEDASRIEGLRLFLMPPERRQLFGISQLTPQLGEALSKGGRVWLY